MYKMSDHLKSCLVKRSRIERNTRKNSASLNSFEIMDPKIWQELSEDLLEPVIARLPIVTFFQFRTVCRNWNSLPTSNIFREHCSQVIRTQPWFYAIAYENMHIGAIYGPPMKTWRHPTMPSLPRTVTLLPVASAGGLVCLVDYSHRQFYIGNPLTQAWKTLPARPGQAWSRGAVGMIQTGNPSSGAYSILWFEGEGEYQIYDSMKNSWARHGDLPPSIKQSLSLNFKSPTVAIGVTIYVLRSDPDGIVSYSIENGSWKQYLIPTPSNSKHHSLAKCGGRILMVGLVTENLANCVCIWELQKMTLLWKEVDRMPNVWCLEFYRKRVEMTCAGNTGLLMLSLRSRQMNRIVTYDVAKREWLKVPGCILSRGRRRKWLACGTAFYPSLAAVP